MVFGNFTSVFITLVISFYSRLQLSISIVNVTQLTMWDYIKHIENDCMHIPNVFIQNVKIRWHNCTIRKSKKYSRYIKNTVFKKISNVQIVVYSHNSGKYLVTHISSTLQNVLIFGSGTSMDRLPCSEFSCFDWLYREWRVQLNIKTFEVSTWSTRARNELGLLSTKIILSYYLVFIISKAYTTLY